MEGHLFGIPFLLLHLLLLGIVSFETNLFTLNDTPTGFTKYNDYYYKCKGSKEGFNQKVANSSLVSKFLSLGCSVPLPTVDGI